MLNFRYACYIWIGVIFTVFADVQFGPLWCGPISFGPFDPLLVRTRQVGPVDWNFFHVDSTFAVAGILEPQINFPWPVHCCTSVSNVCVAIVATLISIFMNIAGISGVGPWLYVYCGRLYLHWNYYLAQLYWTKLIIADEYCWYYGVCGDRAVYPIRVMCLLFCRGRDLSCCCQGNNVVSTDCIRVLSSYINVMFYFPLMIVYLYVFWSWMYVLIIFGLFQDTCW